MVFETGLLCDFCGKDYQIPEKIISTLVLFNRNRIYYFKGQNLGLQDGYCQCLALICLLSQAWCMGVIAVDERTDVGVLSSFGHLASLRNSVRSSPDFTDLFSSATEGAIHDVVQPMSLRK